MVPSITASLVCFCLLILHRYLSSPIRFGGHPLNYEKKKARVNRKLFKRKRHMEGTPRLCPKHTHKHLKVGEMAILDTELCWVCRGKTKNPGKSVA